MKTSPVSFGSMMVVRKPQPGRQIPLKDESGNPALRNYRLQDETMTPTRNADKSLRYNPKDTSIYNTHDATVYNAFKNYTFKLDEEYRKNLGLFKNNPQKVIFSEVDFWVSPHKTEKRYFLTAATEEDEIRIHNILSQSKRYRIGRWEN